MMNPWLALALLLWSKEGQLRFAPSACDLKQVTTQADVLLREPPHKGTYSVVLVHRATCQLVLLKNNLEGKAPKVPGFEIRMVGGWNWSNTRLEVSEPAGWVVVRNRRGRTLYTSYSSDLKSAFPQLVAAGPAHQLTDFDEMYGRVHSSGARSISVRNEPLTYIAERFRREIEYVTWAEHIEVWEENFDRPKVVLGANPSNAYPTCNSSKACGLQQITGGTCHDIRGSHPKLRLPADCNSAGTATHAHVVSLEASVAVFDQKLKIFIDKLGVWVLDDPNLPAWLFAAYNGGQKRLIPAILAHGEDWDKFYPASPGSLVPADGSITSETEGYLRKYYRLRALSAATPVVVDAAPETDALALPSGSH